MERTLSRFADDTKLGGAVRTLEGSTAVQRDVNSKNRLKKQADKKLLRFSMNKHKVLHLGWSSFMP